MAEKDYGPRVKETTTTTGTGSITLAGAVSKHLAFDDWFTDGKTVVYGIVHQDANEWEYGYGTFTGPSTLSRDTVIASSNSFSAVNFSAGTKDVFSTVDVALLAHMTAEYQALTYFPDATGPGSMAFGDSALANPMLSIALSSGQVVGNSQGAEQGTAQETIIYLSRETTDATPTEVRAGTIGYASIPANRSMAFEVTLIARQVAGAAGTVGDSWFGKWHGAIKRDGSNNTSLIGTVVGDVPVMRDSGASAWSVAITADDSNERLKIEVTGEASKTVHWVAKVSLVEVG